MPSFLFYLFSAIMLGFGILVVILRNPVSSALSLAMSFLGLAALFVSLGAFFIGIIQVLVYAGAVMVLFLFIIMLLDIKEEQRRKLNWPAVVGGAVLVLAFTLQLASVLAKFPSGDRLMNSVPLDPAAAVELRREAGQNVPTIDRDLAAGSLPDVKLVGETLFTHYNFHLQIVGVLLLVATVGVIVISRREDKTVAPLEPAAPALAASDSPIP